MFAPTDDGFRKLLGRDPIGAIKDLPTDVLTDLLLYHVVGDKELFDEDLDCNKAVRMLNGEKTFT